MVNQSIIDTSDINHGMNAFQQYRQARIDFLKMLLPEYQSNRDPLSEFSEWLVAKLVGGDLADSRVQKGWDVQTSDGHRIQVKYLANSQTKWVNEHEVRLTDDMTKYAIVIFEALQPQAVLIFPINNLESISKKLGKRHGNLSTNLQFTQANYFKIRGNYEIFKEIGMQLYLPNSSYPENASESWLQL